MAYTSLPEIQRKLELANALASRRSNNFGTQSGSITSGLAQVLNQYRAGKLSKEAAAAQAENEQIRKSDLQSLTEALTGSAGPSQPVSMMRFQSPEVQDMASSMAIQQAMREREAASQRPELMNVPAGGSIFDPQTMQPVFTAPKDADYNQPFLPNGQPNHAYQDYQQRLREAGRTSVSTTVQGDQAADKYVERRGEAQAARMDEIERAAESAYRSNNALVRFVAASAGGDQGALQPIVSGAKNLIASFGFAPDGLVDSAQMDQAIGEILSNKMSELGARGLTDRDMMTLQQSLPRVATSHEARVAVANIVKKANDATINEYLNQAKFESENYPDYRFMRPTWASSYSPLPDFVFEPSTAQSILSPATTQASQVQSIFDQADAIIQGGR